MHGTPRSTLIKNIDNFLDQQKLDNNPSELYLGQSETTVPVVVKQGYVQAAGANYAIMMRSNHAKSGFNIGVGDDK